MALEPWPDESRGPGLLTQLRRHWILIVLTALIGAAAAYFIAKSQPLSYSATSVLQVRAMTPEENITGSGTFQDSASQQRSAATIAAVAQSRPIVESVVRRTDGRYTAREVTKRIEVAADQDANVLRVTATDSSAGRASALANVYAEAFVSVQQARESRSARTARRALEKRYDDLSAAAQDAEPGQNLRDSIERLRTFELIGTGSVTLVEEAVPPTEANENYIRTGLLGGLFGLLLGAGIAFLRDQMDRRVRSGEDLEELLGLPLLAQVPNSRNLGRSRPTWQLKPSEIEPFRMLWTGLRFHGEDPVSRVLLTSPGSQEGKTLVSWYLACAAAESGASVLLMEGDARRPVLEGRHGIEAAPGILGLVEDRLSVSEAVARVPVFRGRSDDNGGPAGFVDVLTADTPTTSLTSVEATDRLLHVLSREVDGYDLVVVDTPPITLASEAIALSTGVDGVIIVSRAKRSTRDGLKHVQAYLKRLQVPVLGVVRDGGDAPDYYGQAPARGPAKKRREPALEA